MEQTASHLSSAPPVRLLMGIHCHQPYQNFSWVLEDACTKSYEPFLQTCLRYPDFRFALHYSGWLLQWIQTNRPAVFDLIGEMASRGQVEIFTGGFFEPILASIPHKDQVGQIEMLSSYIQSNFGQTPKGLWLTERIWDSSIVPAVVQAGVEYAIVDDYHFISAGFEPGALDGHYVTEEGGRCLKLFPISEKLRYTIPFKNPGQTIDHLLEHAREDGSSALTFFDDGEKFGVWPQTNEWVFGERRWLEEFIETVLDHPRVRVESFADYVSDQRPRGIAYLPVCSYYEMGAWTLPSRLASRFDEFYHRVKKEDEATATAFVKGSIWKNFLVKYPESNNIHKKMLRLASLPLGLEAREALYQGQCNDVMWHGVFGGLYLPNLRFNAYEALNRCERLAGRSGVFVGDFNCDGYPEVLARTQAYFASLSSREGAQLYELSCMRSLVNVLNTLTRRHEAYHDKLGKPAAGEVPETVEDADGIASIHDLVADEQMELPPLHYDWHQKYSFVDHFMAELPTDESFVAADLKEQGDFANQPFAVIHQNSGDVLLRRSGGLYRWAEKLAGITVEKRYQFLSQSVQVDVCVESDRDIETFYGCELNFHIPSGVEQSHIEIHGNKFPKDHTFTFDDVRDFCLEDGLFHTPLRVHACTAQRLLGFPVMTVSQSEAGYDATYQGTSFLWCRLLTLRAGERQKMSFLLSFGG